MGKFTQGAFALLLAASSALAIAAPAHEPKRNPYLSPSSPAAPHDNSGAQQSSPNPGPIGNDGLHAEFTPTDSIGIPLLSPAYADGHRVIWMSTQGHVYKFAYEPAGFSLISAVRKPGSTGLPRGVTGMIADKFDALPDREAQIKFLRDELEMQTRIGIDGVYAFVSSDNRIYFLENRTHIVAYGDAEPGNRMSAVKRVADFSIPAERLGPNERLFGVMMTHDGKVAFVTNLGLVGIVDRSLDPATAQYVRLEGERISNSLATDERGGIYVVSHLKMHRVQWTGKALSTDPATGAWSAAYPTDVAQGGLRIDAGSGSTPTLMGSADDPDQLVVITDGSKRMNLVAFWRNEIPAGWRGVPGQDRRLAGLFPVTFGNPKAELIQSDQSVLVTGYGALAVSNTLQKDLGTARPITVALSGDADIAPSGIERIDWDPKANIFRSRWSRPDVSVPNTVPVGSTATNMVYAIGARDGKWLLWGLDWNTGSTKTDFVMGRSLRWNSAYMISTPFPDGSVTYGGYWGLVRIGKGAGK